MPGQKASDEELKIEDIWIWWSGSSLIDLIDWLKLEAEADGQVVPWLIDWLIEIEDFIFFW